MSVASDTRLVSLLLPQGLVLPASGVRGLVGHFIKWERVDFGRLGRELERPLNIQGCSVEELLEHWQHTLALALLNDLLPDPEHSRLIQARCSALLAVPFWPSFQPIAATCSLIQALTGESQTLLPPEIPAEGAAMLDPDGKMPWATVPHPHFLSWLIQVWAIGGLRFDNQAWLDAADAACSWMNQFRAHHGNSLEGLFTQQRDYQEVRAILDHLWLAHGGAIAARNAQLRFRSDQMARKLEAFRLEVIEGAIGTGPLMASLWLDTQHPLAAEAGMPSNVNFIDPSMPIVCHQQGRRTLAATLTGAETGFGQVASGAVSIVSFGPEHAPLGDGQRFGLANGRCQRERPRATMDGDSFHVYGRCELAGRRYDHAHRMANWRSCRASGVWFDVSIRWKDNALTLDCLPSTLEDASELAIAYYVKADNCDVAGGQRLRPGTLDRYEGPPAPVVIASGNDQIKISVWEGVQRLHVIPLAGGDNFWGATYLVAHQLTSSSRRYLGEISL